MDKLRTSLAAGWRISEEQFWKENENLSFINNLKLKASYGILGNNNIHQSMVVFIYLFLFNVRLQRG